MYKVKNKTIYEINQANQTKATFAYCSVKIIQRQIKTKKKVAVLQSALLTVHNFYMPSNIAIQAI